MENWRDSLCAFMLTTWNTAHLTEIHVKKINIRFYPCVKITTSHCRLCSRLKIVGASIFVEQLWID